MSSVVVCRLVDIYVVEMLLSECTIVNCELQYVNSILEVSQDTVYFVKCCKVICFLHVLLTLSLVFNVG